MTETEFKQKLWADVYVAAVRSLTPEVGQIPLGSADTFIQNIRNAAAVVATNAVSAFNEYGPK